MDRRKANVNWLVVEEDGTLPTWERVGIAVLMDIRDELQRLNGLLRCDSFLNIPRHLRAIDMNTRRKKPKGK